MSADNIVALMLTFAVSATGAAIVSGWWNRRKLGAEATKIIADAAAKVVENYKGDNEDLRERVSRLERQHKADRNAQLLHAAWDQMASERLRAHKDDLPPPPPLYAPEVA